MPLIFADVLYSALSLQFSLLSCSPESSLNISWIHASYLAINLSAFNVTENILHHICFEMMIARYRYELNNWWPEKPGGLYWVHGKSCLQKSEVEECWERPTSQGVCARLLMLRTGQENRGQPPGYWDAVILNLTSILCTTYLIDIFWMMIRIKNY